MKNQTNNSLFTDIKLDEAANVNGGYISLVAEQFALHNYNLANGLYPEPTYNYTAANSFLPVVDQRINIWSNLLYSLGG